MVLQSIFYTLIPFVSELPGGSDRGITIPERLTGAVNISLNYSTNKKKSTQWHSGRTNGASRGLQVKGLNMNGVRFHESWQFAIYIYSTMTHKSREVVYCLFVLNLGSKW